MPRYRPLAVLVLAAALAGCATEPAPSTVATGPPELLDREMLFGNPERTNVRISPDGTRISYLAPVDGVLNVWVGPLGDPSAAEPVTHDTGRGVRRYFWAHTNRHVVYLQDTGGDENWRAYRVDLESGETTDLTPIDDVQVKILASSHRKPGEILVQINDRDPQLHDVYRIDLATGERTRLIENPGYLDFVADLDHRVRLAIRFEPDGGQSWWRRTDGGWEEQLRVPSEDAITTGPAGFDASGGRLYMVDSRDRETAALVALDLESGEREVLFEDPKADTDDLLIHPTERTVQAAASTYTRREWKVLDNAIRGDLDYLATVADGELEVVDRSLDDRRWIVGYGLADHPFSYYLYDRDPKRATYLFSVRPALEEATLAPMHAVVIPSRDGLELVSYLTLPVESDPDGDGRPAAAVPMVLMVHGGPWGRDSWGYDPWHQWLANRGYAVLSVNFRGSTGLGKGFVNAGDHEWGRHMHNDLIDAVEWAAAQGIAQRDKVAIMGGSYGGYATLAGVTMTPEAFACGVSIVGPSNLITLLESIPPYWKPLYELFAARIGDPRTEEGKALLVERSPLTHADKIVRPLLIGQGANDPRVKQAESDQIVDAMTARNIPVTYVLFPDEGHGFARPENRLAFNAVAEAFLGECLGGRVEPVGDDFEGSSITVPAGAEGVGGVAAALVARNGGGETAGEGAGEAAPAGAAGTAGVE